MKKNNSTDWLNEYQDFINTQTTSVPAELTQAVFSKLLPLLRPSAWLVFFKILSVQLVTGYLSLSVCHQFGVNPFNTSRSLDAVFMSWGGHHVCMTLCGVLFVGLGLVASGIFLNVEEVVALKKTKFLQIISLGLISLGLLVAVGAEFALGIGLLWLFGAVLGGYVATETVWRIKTLVRS